MATSDAPTVAARYESGLAAAGGAALACAAVAAVAMAGGGLPTTRPALVVPPVLAACVVFAAVSAVWPWPRWTRRRLALGLLVAAAAGIASAAWFLVRPAFSPMAETGLPTLADAVAFLPGLLAWAALRQPGAVLLGLTVGELVASAATGAALPAAGLLQVPIVAAPVEAWFLARGPGRARSSGGLLGAGIVMGLSAGAAAYLLRPGVAAPGSWAVLVLMRAMAGLVAGWLVARFVEGSVWARVESSRLGAGDA